jgi:hypothetical protein
MASKPTAKTLFALYPLGLDSAGKHAFRNIGDVARIYAVDRGTATAWLKAGGIDPDTVGSVEFNLSALHVDAMFVAAGELEAFVDKAWRGYSKARETAIPGKFHHDIDYDDVWQDEVKD